MTHKIKLNFQDYQLEEESEIINKKFIQLIKSRQEISEPSPKQFSLEQLDLIEKRYKQLSPSLSMTEQQFRKGLGLLGRQQSFLSRIFYILDKQSKQYLTLDDFVSYLNIILNGTSIQKARFGWQLLTQGKPQLQLQDLINIFQEISVVWNALTGDIITPKKKYIQQLFSIFDVDDDQIITFSDYQVYFDEQPHLFGWYQYLNNTEIDERKIKQELGDIRKKLKQKLQLDMYGGIDDGLTQDQIDYRIKDFQNMLQRKTINLTDKIKQVTNQQKKRNQQLFSYSKKGTRQDSQFMKTNGKIINTNVSLFQNLNNSFQNSVTNKSSRSGTNTSLEEVNSIKSLFKYNHQNSDYSSQMSRIKNRKQKQQKETKLYTEIQLIKEIQGMLEQTSKLLTNCEQYRILKQKQKKFSPTKLKKLEVKYNVVDRQINNQEIQKHQKQGDKKKMTVYFGHENWNLVLNIMVGLRKSIKSLYQLKSHLQLYEDSFGEEHQYVLGNKTLIGKDSQVYKFVQKAPLVFQRLRNSFGLTNQQYQKSVGPQSLLNQLFIGNLTALNQKCSTGKSGAFFYLTLDNKIFLKTLKKDEYLVFQKMIKNYYQHMTTHKNSLIVRMYGLYKLKMYVNKEKIKTIYFISMENIFYNISKENNLRIKQVYDLKGSLYGRTGEEQSQFKDNDWVDKKKKIKLPENLRKQFIDKITLDSKFFKKNNINDYSLMIAMVEVENSSKIIQKPQENVFKTVNGGVYSSEKGILYVMSIIDILTAFQTVKTMEYLLKSTFLSKDVSCIPPAEYSKRFRQFIISHVQ